MHVLGLICSISVLFFGKPTVVTRSACWNWVGRKFVSKWYQIDSEWMVNLNFCQGLTIPCPQGCFNQTILANKLKLTKSIQTGHCSWVEQNCLQKCGYRPWDILTRMLLVVKCRVKTHGGSKVNMLKSHPWMSTLHYEGKFVDRSQFKWNSNPCSIWKISMSIASSVTR